MPKHYTLSLSWIAYLLLVNPILQSCNNLSTPLSPIKGAQEPLIVKVDRAQSPNFLEEEDKAWTIEGDDRKRVEKQLLTTHATSAKEIASSLFLGELGRLPVEIMQIIFLYVGSKEMSKVRQLSKTFYQVITGYEHPKLGVVYKPEASKLTEGLALHTRVLDCRSRRGKVTPETIPSYPFYRLVAEAQNLPRSFWPYLADTRVYTLYLYNNQIGAVGVKELAAVLPSTKVHTLDLHFNQIGDVGVKELATVLPTTKVHTLNLRWNQIGDVGVKELAAVLANTKLHTLNLERNKIGALGVKELAVVLANTKVHTLNLGSNEIGDVGVKELAAVLSNTKVHTLTLCWNQIDDVGVQELIAGLANTKVHTLFLGGNQISDQMKALLKREHPHITWYF